MDHPHPAGQRTPFKPSSPLPARGWPSPRLRHAPCREKQQTGDLHGHAAPGRLRGNVGRRRTALSKRCLFKDRREESNDEQDGRTSPAAGDLGAWTADREVIATGRALAPGIIGSHTHDDRAVLCGPSCATVKPARASPPSSPAIAEDLSPVCLAFCVRAAGMNGHWFLLLADRCKKLEASNGYYKAMRPHRATGN